MSRTAARATVPVRFGDERRDKTVVEFRLHRIGRTWRVDDLRYEDGTTFRRLLKPEKG